MVGRPLPMLLSCLLFSILLHDSYGFVSPTTPLRESGQSHHGQYPRTVISNPADNSVVSMITTTTKITLPTFSRSSRNLRLNLSANDFIEAGVSFDTFAPQFLWLLMIAAPRSSLTKTVMDPITPILVLSAVHLGIVLIAASQEGALAQIAIFGEVFDPSLSQLDGMTKLFEFRNFVAEEWPHVLVWDLFVGRIVWRDGLERDVDTRVSLSFCNFIGPPGLLIYVATCLLGGKGLPKV
mmetsp:Transcript_36211/g.43243  ORF Transcript_36211/g.43243 Transcript_36211/m.43243 type:complete len:238 (+) Transcript_36211:72-785(+)